MTRYDEAAKRYEKLFPDLESKAAAFDRIAERYYLQNFSTFPKAELDLLMFSEYLDRCYLYFDDDSREMSDYSLSKFLGITQGRVASLKERKELKYPSEFDWRAAFAKVLCKAEYRDGRVRVFVEDSRLHSELCNVVRELGGYSEATLTKQLIVVSPTVFIDLMVEATEDISTKEEMRRQLASIVSDNGYDPLSYEEGRASLIDIVRGAIPGTTEKIVLAALGLVPGLNPVLFAAAEGLIESIIQGLTKQ